MRSNVFDREVSYSLFLNIILIIARVTLKVIFARVTCVALGFWFWRFWRAKIFGKAGRIFPLFSTS